MALVLGAWYFLFHPRDIEDRRMRLQIEAKQKQLQKLNRATATIGCLKDEITDLEKAIGFFQSKLPNEKEIDKVLEEVWRLAETNNLATKGIYTAKRSGASCFLPECAPQTEQPINMEFEGDFVGFYGFLLALENQPRIMRVRTMSLDPQSEGKKGGIKAKLEMSIFFENSESTTKKPQAWLKKT
jgi:Tfp pilus assembly protein PilO